MIRARINYLTGWDALELWITQRDHLNDLRFLKVETIQSSVRGENAKPFIAHDAAGLDTREFIQAIMDAGWDYGIRPAGYKDVENETKVLKNHLDDMRRLVFSHINPYRLTELK